MSTTGLKVLVIDDSNTIRRSAEIFLKQGGHEVMLAEDGFDVSAFVNAKVQLGARARMTDFYARQFVRARHLDRLHPLAAFLAHPQGDVRLGQFAVVGIEIAGAQRNGPGARRT